MHILRFVVLSALLALSACASTSIERENPFLVLDTAQPSTGIYFLRPDTSIKKVSLGDNPVEVALNGEPLLELGKGEYTFVQVKPGRYSIDVSFWSWYTGQRTPQKLTRNLTGQFQPGETYYIAVNEKNEEFRGLLQQPSFIDLAEAERLVRELSPVAQAKTLPLAAQ